MLTATALATLVSLGAGAVLLNSSSSQRRGIGLGVTGAAAVVLIGGIAFAFVVLR
ncbi:hypothetical protein MJO63_25735 [Mycobacterium ulcerans]|uniref:Uncharacterized protein n=1 Tax=Mycobacterium ulcerans TaxID=1809 RepID=A0ABY5TX58_MYCUL|nr:hypothetical protein [Mycobacterium ulcerans]UVY89949.1 hypothetical protein MJO63_25735 [Mycobacterium ulcerans]